MARRLGRGAKLPAHLETGLRGEREALFELRRMGYTVVARRWQTAKVRGDVDLIGWKGDTLCFIEVKTRTAARRLRGGGCGGSGEAGAASEAGAGVLEIVR